MKKLVSLAPAALLLATLHATHSLAATAPMAPLPGGDCVLSLNPKRGGYGPSIQIGYDLNGGAAATTHTVQMGSSSQAVTVGAIGGTREKLITGHVYDVIITNMEGPTVRLVNKTDPSQPDLHPSVSAVDSADMKVNGFSVIPRPYRQSGTEYTVVAILGEVTDSAGRRVTKGVKFAIDG